MSSADSRGDDFPSSLDAVPVEARAIADGPAADIGGAVPASNAMPSIAPMLRTAKPALFQSFLHAGFECATQRHPCGHQLDLVESTGHERLALWDYRTLVGHGVSAARDGLRWHCIENSPGRYDWTSALAQVRAARESGMQVIWDLAHWGWPRDIDIWRPAFVERFARFAAAAAKFVHEELGEGVVPWFCPVNEVSFWSWAGGDVAFFQPAERGRAFELKCQLVRAEVEAIRAIRAVVPSARFVHADPIIHVVAKPDDHSPHPENCRVAQYQRWDMVAGRLWPLLGGSEDCLDVIGANYYHNNQWEHGGPPITAADPRYRPLAPMLKELGDRYPGRAVYLAETGAEGDRRIPWLNYVADECAAALRAGVDLQGICLYPITDYHGWSDDRHCPTGVLGFPYAPGEGEGRPVRLDYLNAVKAQQQRLESIRAAQAQPCAWPTTSQESSATVGALDRLVATRAAATSDLIGNRGAAPTELVIA